MTQTIVITSGKGGVGKTNISVNIAIELAQRNYRTCLFDADLGLANVNILLGIHPENTLDDYIFGDKNLDEVILQTKFGIDVIPGSSGIEKMANLDREKISDLVASLSQIKGYDYFLIDTSSGISRGVIAFCLASTETIIVITSEATSVTDGYALLKVMALNHYSGTVKILVNKSPSIPHAKETYLRFKEVVHRHLEIDIAPAGTILNDPNIELSVTRQEPALILYPNSIASQCIRALVSNLLKNEPIEHEGDNFSEFWQRYFAYSILDLSSEPDKPADENKSFELIESEDNNPLPPSVPPTMPLTLPNEDQCHSQEMKRSTDLVPESIVQFAHDDGIFEASILSSPTPLLSKALDWLVRGELTQERLLNIFSCDPVLMVKALKMMHGPEAQSNRPKRVTAKHQLVQELGTEVLTKLLNTATMQSASSQRPPDTAQLTSSFWSHSYTCALLAESIAKILKYPFPEEAFIAGLIHDIGRLALETDHPEVYTQYPKTFRHEEELLEMEQRIFKSTHAEIGANALRSWHLNSFLVDAVQYHTESISTIMTAFNLVKIVSLACRLTQPQEDQAETSKLGETLFEFSPSQLQSLITDAQVKTQQLAYQFNISLTKEMEDDTKEEIQTRFRHQVMEYSVLQGVLPPPLPTRELPEIIRSIFQAFDILFNIKPSFCLMPDFHHSFLEVIEYPDCFGWGTLADIQFSLAWENSMVVKSFHSGELKTAMEGESSGVLPLADRQLLRSLGTQGFVCVPMVTNQINRGVIVFGIPKKKFEEIQALRNRLEQFGGQAARNIYSLAKV